MSNNDNDNDNDNNDNGTDLSVPLARLSRASEAYEAALAQVWTGRESYSVDAEITRARLEAASAVEQLARSLPEKSRPKLSNPEPKLRGTGTGGDGARRVLVRAHQKNITAMKKLHERLSG